MPDSTTTRALEALAIALVQQHEIASELERAILDLQAIGLQASARVLAIARLELLCSRAEGAHVLTRAVDSIGSVLAQTRALAPSTATALRDAHEQLCALAVLAGVQL